MIWNFRHCVSHTLHRHRLLSAVRMLLFAMFGLTLLGQCLPQDLHAAPFSHVAMECHDDCWYQRPSLQPVAMLQHTPVPSLPPEPYVRFVLPALDTLPGYDDHGRSLSPRSPPIIQYQ
jgi:hypothetical protein